MHLDRFDGLVSEVWLNECIAEVGINSVCKLRCGCGHKLHSGFPDQNSEPSLERKGVSRLAVIPMCKEPHNA